jgi:predicted CXXCH cytochrome family protein
MEGKARHYPAFSGRQCLSCHSPHAGSTKTLLAKTTPELCYDCHGKDMMRKKLKHAAAEMGCNTCHVAHTGGEPKLLNEELVKLCLQCHDKVPKTHMHGMGKSPYVDAVTGKYIDCASCHNPHSSDHEKLTHGDRKRELCTRCHKRGQHEL